MLIATLLLLAAPQAAEAPDPSGGKDKLICKREVPIGSLIASRKICLTKSQWERRAQDGNDEARKQAYDNMGRPACNDVSTC